MRRLILQLLASIWLQYSIKSNKNSSKLHNLRIDRSCSTIPEYGLLSKVNVKTINLSYKAAILSAIVYLKYESDQSFPYELPNHISFYTEGKNLDEVLNLKVKQKACYFKQTVQSHLERTSTHSLINILNQLKRNISNHTNSNETSKNQPIRDDCVNSDLNEEIVHLKWFLGDFSEEGEWHDTEVLLGLSDPPWNTLYIIFRGSDSGKDLLTNSQWMKNANQSARYSQFKGKVHRGILNAYHKVNCGHIVKIDGNNQTHVKDDESWKQDFFSPTIGKVFEKCVESRNRRIRILESSDPLDGDSDDGRTAGEDLRHQPLNRCLVKNESLSDMLVQTVLSAIRQKYRVVLSGHSLGGAHSLLLAIDVVVNHPYQVHNEEDSDGTLKSTSRKTKKLEGSQLSKASDLDDVGPSLRVFTPPGQPTINASPTLLQRLPKTFPFPTNIIMTDNYHTDSLANDTILQFETPDKQKTVQPKANPSHRTKRKEHIPIRNDYYSLLHIVTFGAPDFADEEFFASAMDLSFELRHILLGSTLHHHQDGRKTSRYVRYVSLSKYPHCNPDIVTQLVTQLGKNVVGKNLVGVDLTTQRKSMFVTNMTSNPSNESWMNGFPSVMVCSGWAKNTVEAHSMYHYLHGLLMMGWKFSPTHHVPSSGGHLVSRTSFYRNATIFQLVQRKIWKSFPWVDAWVKLVWRSFEHLARSIHTILKPFHSTIHVMDQVDPRNLKVDPVDHRETSFHSIRLVTKLGSDVAEKLDLLFPNFIYSNESSPTNISSPSRHQIICDGYKVCLHDLSLTPMD